LSEKRGKGITINQINLKKARFTNLICKKFKNTNKADKIKMKQNMTALMVLCLVMLGATAQAAVLGIDFGSSYFKISLNAPKKQFLIVENLTSNRKTMNAVIYI